MSPKMGANAAEDRSMALCIDLVLYNTQSQVDQSVRVESASLSRASDVFVQTTGRFPFRTAQSTLSPLHHKSLPPQY